jgi:hypothetical protein
LGGKRWYRVQKNGVLLRYLRYLCGEPLRYL